MQHYRSLLQGLTFSGLQNLTPLFGREIVVIDGLDECNLAQRRLVLTFLASIVNHCDEREPGRLRVLFVSQDFPDIGKAIQTATVLKLSPEDNKNDIKGYVYEWSKKIREKYALDNEQIGYIQESTLIRSQGRDQF